MSGLPIEPPSDEVNFQVINGYEYGQTSVGLWAWCAPCRTELVWLEQEEPELHIEFHLITCELCHAKP